MLITIGAIASAITGPSGYCCLSGLFIAGASSAVHLIARHQLNLNNVITIN
ncbi:hypothetical protein [Serratia liquefaciens]|uniref:hypothetical protein n=1 Tax=Serratia liquefaciens TaxID=614 RepID=UPI000E0526FC|nr:hypothetical protein [Serratia liquefaciens]MBF8107405.1 hypothetical protein [Serratia liquefaciens]SUI44948.1 Uncharacterised protein [Serratia liquefaciens]